MSQFLKLFIFVLFVVSNISAELPGTFAKDPINRITFEMKFLTRTEIENLPDCANNLELKNYLLQYKIYRCLTSNLLPGAKYSIYSIDMENNATLLNTFTATTETDLKPLGKNDEGLNIFSEKVWCIGKTFLNGEPFSLKLLSEDSKTSLILKFIPNPIEHKWEDGASVYIEAFEKSANHFSFYGNNFKPNEKLSFIFISGKEKIPFTHSAGKIGDIKMGLAPAVIGKKGGDAEIIITRENKKDRTILKYFWGLKAIKNKN